MTPAPAPSSNASHGPQPGRLRFLGHVVRLTHSWRWYLAEDHLLLADRGFYTVTYTRFYLDELQTLAVWPTRGRRTRCLLLGLLSAVLAILFWVTGLHRVIFLLAALALAVAALEWIRGPLAQAEIRTPGQARRLALSSRLPASLRAARAIAAAAAAYQPPVVAALPLLSRSQKPSSTSASPAMRDRRGWANGPYSALIWTMLVLLLTKGVMDLGLWSALVVAHVQSRIVRVVLGSALDGAFWIVLILCLLKIHRYRTAWGLRAWLWTR